MICEGEGHDRGLDRDAAPPFQREGVGGGVPVVDAADAVDNARGEQEPFGQAGLSGVNMRHDPEIERSHESSCP
jgi:hypothetical protein